VVLWGGFGLWKTGLGFGVLFGSENTFVLVMLGAWLRPLKNEVGGK